MRRHSPVAVVVADVLARWQRTANANRRPHDRAAGDQEAGDVLAAGQLEIDRLRQVDPALEAEAAAARHDLGERWRRGWRGGAA